MSLNQQLTEPRVSGILSSRQSSRLWIFMALVAAAALVAGCKSAPEPQSDAYSRAAPSTASATADRADDLTATEAAIARLNEPAAADAPAPTAQLIRPDAPMNYTVKRGDTMWDIAAAFLKAPWFWPEIWQINPRVETPHRTYPGDVLSLAYGANGDALVSISQYSGARLEPRLRSEELAGPVYTLPFAAISAFLTKPSVLSKD